MPTTSAPDGTSLFYEVDGAGETVVFVGEACLGAWQWGWQQPKLAGPYRTVVWDHRGVGNSEYPEDRFDVETLAADLEAVCRATETARAHLVGTGLGGMVALRHSRRYGRARSLTLFGCAASGTDVDRTVLEELLPAELTDSSLRASLSGAFSSEFRAARSDLVEQITDWRRREDASGESRSWQLDAMLGYESGPLFELSLPTLVCHGLADPVVPVASGRELAEDLPRGTFEPLEGRHLAHVEHSRAVTDRLLDFLDEHRLS